jgi:flagellin
MQASYQIGRVNRKLARSTSRLSSGYKITTAQDDAAGMAISNKMKAQITGLTQASINSTNGISLVQIAEGALSQVNDMLGRMRELAVQASNDTNTTEDREKMQMEIDQLIEELDSNAIKCEYNTIKLLHGDADRIFKVDPFPETIPLYMTDNMPYGDLNFTVTDDITATMTSAEDPSAVYILDSGEDWRYTFRNMADGSKITMEVAGVAGAYKINTQPSAMVLHVGPNKDMTMTVRIPKVTAATLGADRISVVEWDDAQESINRADNAIDIILDIRGKLGAFQNRMEFTVVNIDVQEESSKIALSRVLDTDMAAEMTEYSKNNIIMQAAMAMLAQSNQRPESVLQLIQ